MCSCIMKRVLEDDVTKYDLESIMNITKSILDDSMSLLGFSVNIRQKIKQRMTLIFKNNLEIRKLKRPDEIVFILMLRAINELRLPYNKQKMMCVIQNHVKKHRIHRIDHDISESLAKKLKI